MGPHTTSDDPNRYRPPHELEEWAARDPIVRFRSYLERMGVWTQRVEERVAARSARLRTELRAAVMETPDPDVTEVFDTVFAEITPSLAAQRQQLLTELAEGEMP